jgi:hypothetical protein
MGDFMCNIINCRPYCADGDPIYSMATLLFRGRPYCADGDPIAPMAPLLLRGRPYCCEIAPIVPTSVIIGAIFNERRRLSDNMRLMTRMRSIFAGSEVKV